MSIAAPFEAFRFLCRCIAFTEGDPEEMSALRTRIRSDSIDWARVIRIADRHYILPLLFQRLKEKRLVTELLPDSAGLLQNVFELNLTRNRLHIRQVMEIARCLNAVNIEPLLLKGAAALFSALYPSEGSRMMNDLDMLVPESALSICIDVLMRSGYRFMEGVNLPEDHHHALPLVHPDFKTRVELHSSPVEAQYHALLSAREMWDKSERVYRDGVGLRIPHPHSFVIHNIVHHQLSDKGYVKNRISLKQMLDHVMVQKKHYEKVDWCDMKKRFQDTGHLAPFLHDIAISCRLFQLKIPEKVCSQVCSLVFWSRFYILFSNPGWIRFARALTPYLKEIRKSWKDPGERKTMLKKFYRFKTYQKNIGAVIHVTCHSKDNPLK